MMLMSRRLRAFAAVAAVAANTLSWSAAAAASHQEVASLLERDSGAVTFGDGVSGRQLPFSSAFLAARYAAGQGNAGNVAASPTLKSSVFCPLLGC